MSRVDSIELTDTTAKDVTSGKNTLNPAASTRVYKHDEPDAPRINPNSHLSPYSARGVLQRIADRSELEPSSIILPS